MSGFFSQLLDPDQPRIAGPAMADGISGLYAALGIASALAGRVRDGKGHRLDVAMIEAMAALVRTHCRISLEMAGYPDPTTVRPHHSRSPLGADKAVIGSHLSSPQSSGIHYWK